MGDVNGLIDIDFVKFDAGIAFESKLLKDGRDSSARTTPGCPEVNEGVHVFTLDLKESIVSICHRKAQTKLQTSSLNLERSVIGVTVLDMVRICS